MWFNMGMLAGEMATNPPADFGIGSLILYGLGALVIIFILGLIFGR